MDDLSQFRAAIEALRQVAHNPASYHHGLAEADRRFRAELAEAVRKEGSSATGRMRSAGTTCRSAISALRPPKTDKEALAQIKAAVGLTDRQVRNVRSVRLLGQRGGGGLCFRDESQVLLTPARAAAYLSVLGCLIGLALSSILYEESQGPWLWGYGAALGVAIGSLAGLVLDRSYRIYPVVEKLRAAEPWLAGLEPHSDA